MDLLGPIIEVEFFKNWINVVVSGKTVHFIVQVSEYLQKVLDKSDRVLHIN